MPLLVLIASRFMLTVKILSDPLQPDAVQQYKCARGCVTACLQGALKTWSDAARIYRGPIAAETDITPRTQADVDFLEQLDDETLTVVLYPEGPVAVIVGVVAGLALATVALLALAPKIPSIGSDVPSSNNQLGNRANKPRPNERIPDIFGEVLAIPELLTPPITTFEDNVEVEVAFMCVGRGSYEISEVKDGGTPLTLIAGAGAEFYGPGTSPNGGVPFLTVGTPVSSPFRKVLRVNEVNGQQLDSPDANKVSGTANIRFVAPNFIQNSGGIDFTEFFGAGDDIVVTGASFGASSEVILDAVTTTMRFHSDKRIEFETFDPSTVYSAGQTLILQNAVFVGQDETTGDVIYINVSGRYQIATVNATTIGLA